MPVLTSSPALRNIRGELRLRFSANAAGNTILSERFRRGLYHFSKSYRENERLILQVLNPTAGLFAGDHLQAQIGVDDGANACLLAPSSTQVYTMSDEGWASAEQCFRVGQKSTLVFHPRWSVLHKGARFRQKTSIHLDSTASLLFIDQVAAGRSAHGEFLEFDQLQNDLECYRGTRLVLKERLACGKSDRTWFWSHAAGSAAFFTTILVASPTHALDAKACVIALNEAKDPQTSFGLSELETGLFALRILSPNNCTISRLLHLFCAFLPNELSLSSVSSRIH